MSSSSSAERWRRRLPAALATVAVLAAVGSAGSREAAAADPADPVMLRVEGAPLADVSTSDIQLVPAFAPGTTDYVLRCRPGVNRVGLTLTGASGGTVQAGALSGPRVTTAVELVENQAVVLEAADGKGGTTSYWIRCLPSDFPTLTVTASGTAPAGWYVTGNIRSTTGNGTYAMILDANGTPVWYQKTSGQGAIDVTPVAKNVAAWASNPGPGFGTDPDAAFNVYDLSTRTTQRLRAPIRPLDFHELLPLANGNYVVLATPLRPGIDLRRLGFGRNQAIVDCVVEEVTPSGQLVWKWRSSDHLSTAESTHPDPVVVDRQRAFDVFHCNSVDEDPATGDLLVSFRAADAVYRIRRSTGKVVWKLGGNAVVGDGERHLVVSGDPQKSFYGQHDARFRPGDDISLFDNQTWHLGAARGVEYHVDTQAGTARLVWEYRASDGGHSNATGAFRRYDHGTDNLIAWGFKPNSLFTEVDAAGRVLLDVSLPKGDWAYRAVKTPLDQFDADLLHRTAGLQAAPFPLSPRILSLGVERSGRGEGASVVITGKGLAGATAVMFGTVPATSFVVPNDGVIRAIAPPGAGSAEVTVTTAGGTSNPRPVNMLEGSDSTFSVGIGSWVPNVNAAVTPSLAVFRSRPSALEIRPRTTGFCSTLTSQYRVAGSAAVSGGIWARLAQGEARMRLALIFYDDLGSVLWIEQSPFRRVAGHWLRLRVAATSPAGSSSVALAVDGLRCRTALYVDDASLSGGTRYIYPRSDLRVASVGPDSGSRSGGAIVTITGGGFSTATSVRFGTALAPSFAVTSDSSITAVAPSGSGTVPVIVVTDAGASAAQPTNLLDANDSTFEKGPGSWIGNVNATAISSRTARTGSYSLQLKPMKPGFQSVVSGAYPAAARGVYELQLFAYTPKTSQHVRPFMIFYGGSGEILAIEQGPVYVRTAARAWTKLKLEARSPEGTTAVAVGVDDADGRVDLYLDDVSLTGSTRFTYR